MVGRQIENFKKLVCSTNSYNEASHMMKKLTTKHNNLKVLERGVLLINKYGWEIFEESYNYNWINKCILKELYENGKI